MVPPVNGRPLHTTVPETFPVPLLCRKIAMAIRPRSIARAPTASAAMSRRLRLGPAPGSLKVEQQVKCFQGWHGALEADSAGQEAVGRRGLRHDGADEVIGQGERPDLFADQLWRLAAQLMHLHGGLDRLQIELDLPAIMPPKRKTCINQQ